MNDNLIYDVGLHKGEDTSYYLKKGYRVVAFEADPDLVSICKERFEEEIESGRLVIVEGAIVDDEYKEEMVAFYKNENTVWGTVEVSWAKRNELLGSSSVEIKVRAIRFEEELKRYGIPYYLKVDIEGLDQHCLRVLKKFNERPKFVSIESEKVSFSVLKEEFVLLKELGYNVFNVINQETIDKQRNPTRTLQGLNSTHTFEVGSSGLFGLDIQKGWTGANIGLLKYRLIFIGYRLFGDNGILKKTKRTKWIKLRLEKIFRTKIPGWYDTHAGIRK